jgi:ABC transporter DrrB family efflux protein
MRALLYQATDTLQLGKRNLLRFRRAPELLLGFVVQPVMFILLFVYVLGGAIQTPGFGNYTDFLMPGIIVQTIAFGGFATAIALSEDMRKGLIDRFRSLPIARSAVLAGRTISDVVTNLVALVAMIVVGLLVGFSFDANAAEIVAGVLLMLAFGFAFSWVFAVVGLASGTPEAAQQIGFIFLFPLTFASSAFVPVDSMPGWLEAFAKVNPFTHIVDAMRALWLDQPAGDNIWLAIVWTLGITIVFSAIATQRYRRAVTR